MTQNFVHLHNHTEFSLLDGALRVNDLIKQAKEFAMPAVAMTDHGVLYGLIDFYKKAQQENIKPLIGCEVYLTPGSYQEKHTRQRYHLLLIAENNEGYHNLLKLVSKSWLEGFYYKPRIDKDLLYEHRQGLLGLSACIQGEIPSLILNNREEAAFEAAREYSQIFGQDNFFIELQDHQLSQEKKAATALIKLARKMDLPLVLTNDTHYLRKKDAKLQDILLALQTGTTIKAEKRMKFTGEEFYFKSPDEMRDIFPHLPETIDNTLKIAERCHVNLQFDKFYLPEFPGLPKEKTPTSLLAELCQAGLQQKGMQEDQVAKDRLAHELGVIKQMGYDSYFLIVHDFISYAEKNNIRVGPGRGSAAGSLVSYLLNITRINPLKYGLLFERFLNPARVTMPDIDIDFDEQRDKIIDYVKNRYGNHKVAQIGTFGTMAARAAIRDVGRALDMAYGKVDRIAKLIPSVPGITIDKAMQKVAKLTEIYENEREARSLIDFARGLEGMPRHISTHAAGVIIGPCPLQEIIPLQTQDENIITQLPMGDLEELGLLKMDFLGLRNLTVIENTLQLVEDNSEEKIDIDQVPLDDSDVYQLLQTGETMGVFQMESYLFQNLNRRLKPDRFTDIIALLALGRPGPLGSNMVDDFIAVRHGEKEAKYLHPSLEPILAETFGMILYQEQVMEIASKLAGYSMGEADLLRRGMGKKKKKLVANEREKFVAGAQENGISVDIANEIFDQMEYFSGYGFNKSHSAAYALLAYQTAYLKVHYPAEFMSSLLSSVMSNQDKISKYISATKEMGIEVLPPNVNKSRYGFTPDAGMKIRFGLKAIKNVGEGAIEAIIKGRKKQPYQSLHSFFKQIDLQQITVQTVEGLIKSGAMDSFPGKRSQLLVTYEDLYQKFNAASKEKSAGQRSFFDLFDDKQDKDNDFFTDELDYPEIAEMKIDHKLEQEREYIGIYLSGHPLDNFKLKKEKLPVIAIDEVENIHTEQVIMLMGLVKSIKEHLTKRKNQMAFLTIEDWLGKIELIIFPDLYSKLEFPLKNGDKILFVGKRDEDKIIAKNIINLEQKILMVNINGLSWDKIGSLKKICLNHQGRVPLFLQTDLSNSKEMIIADRRYWINLEESLVTSLEDLCGTEALTYL